MRRLTILIPLLLCCVALIVSMGTTPPSQIELPSTTQINEEITETRQGAFVAAVERSCPAVVAVGAVEHYVRGRRSLHGRVLIDPEIVSQAVPFLGSGVIIDGEKGLIITNTHVVTGREELLVTLPDGRQLPAELVGNDPSNDIALLRVESEETLPSMPLGASAGLRVGQWGLAIGNPFGDLINDPQPTVTAGVISALHRDFRDPNSGQVYLDMIQTDAGINPGNSGGALVNARGELIGINTFMISPTRSSADIGFAIPVDRVKRVIEDLESLGHVRPIYRDFRVRAFQPWLARYLEMEHRPGAIVWEIDVNGPAAEAGLAVGDVVVGINSHGIQTARELQDYLFTLRVGEPIQLRVMREGDPLTVGYVLTEGRH